jgi:hypothetical protein
MISKGKTAFAGGIFFLIILLLLPWGKSPWRNCVVSPPFPAEKGLFLRIRYFGKGKDLSAFSSLGEELSLLPKEFLQGPPFFRTLKSLGDLGITKKTPFFVEAHLFWDTRRSLWEALILSSLTQEPGENNILENQTKKEPPPFQSASLPGGTLLFSSGVFEENARRLASKALSTFGELQSPFLKWEFSDGGFCHEKYPFVFKKPLFLQGYFSLSPGKSHVSWNLEDPDIFSVEIQNLPLWEKRVRYTPIFIPSPLILEGGCSDVASLVFFLKKALALDALQREDRLFPEKWRSLLEKGLTHFSNVSLPLAFAVGGKGRFFQVFSPGFLLHFPEGGRDACARVENVWRRLSFFLKPLKIIENSLCGGQTSFPISLLATVFEGETLGGMITEDSFSLSKSQKSSYPLFFGETPSLAWFILDIPMLYKSTEEFFLEGNMLGQIPFRFLPLVHAVNAVGYRCSLFGVLACAFFGDGTGEIILSSDIFNR